jgi:hypothetical protein
MSVGERVLMVTIVGVTVLVLIVTTLRSYRRGGPMPRVLPMTRRGRERMNATWEKHGWAKSFDEQGNLLPAREREQPRDD